MGAAGGIGMAGILGGKSWGAGLHRCKSAAEAPPPARVSDSTPNLIQC